MSLGKLLVNSLFRQQVQRSFVLHRDLKSCLSLSQAEKIIQARELQVKQYGKTAFLQFLNNFPLNYSYKFLDGPLKVFLFSLELQNLSTYEEQLRYAILVKLKQYLCATDKPIIQQHINNSQQNLMEIIKKKPFDATHAMNFLHLQKDNRNNQLFYHCLDVIKNTQYRILETVMPRMAAQFIKRLSLSEWNIIRKFQYLIDHLTFEYVPKEVNNIHYVFLLDNIAKLQLHTVGYQKIPPAIDFIIGYFMQNLDNDRNMDIVKLLSIFKAFDYLPMGYNQHAFNAIFKKILQRAQKQTLHMDILPFRHMSAAQVTTLFNKCPKLMNFNDIIYSGNNHISRKFFLKSTHPEKLYEEFMDNSLRNRKNYFSTIITSVILLDYYKNDLKTKEVLKAKIIKTLSAYKSQNDLLNFSKYYSISNICNFIRLENELKTGQYDHLISRLTQEIITRANSEDFKELKFIDNYMEAVYLYADSPIVSIRRLLTSILINLLKKSNKFYFQIYPDLALTLLKSQYVNEYRAVLQSLLSIIPEGDCKYFIELYNRYPSKTIKSHHEIIDLMWKIDPSLGSMGKFMVTSSYSHFTSSRGELTLNFRKILESIEPLMNVNQLNGYVLPELTSILRFCSHFYYFISEFSRKFLLISLQLVETLDIKRDGGKFIMNYLQEAISLKVLSNSSDQIHQKLAILLNKVGAAFPDSLIFKTKQLQFRWLLGEFDSEDRISLIVEEILSQLSNSNYSQKHADSMALLLKLNCLQAIKLKEIVVEKLTNLILNGMEENEIKAKEIINQIYIPMKKGGSSIDQKHSESLSKLLITCLDRVKGKQSFDYYMHIVNFGHYIKNVQLVAKGFENLSKPLLYPPQIKNIVNVLRFYRNISVDLLIERLLLETVNHFDYLHAECAEILFSSHFLKNQMSQKQIELTKSILQKHEALLISEPKSFRHYEGALMKHLWVCLKINQFNMSMKPLFKAALDSYKVVKTKSEKGNYDGIPNENIALIYSALIKLIEVNEPKFFERMDQEQRKTMFKSAKATIPPHIKSITQDSLKVMEYLSKNSVEATQKSVAQYFITAGLQRASSQSHDQDNIFDTNKKVNNVILNGWVKKDTKEYGILYLQDRYFSNTKKYKGRINFTLNSLRIITQMKMVILEPGQEIKWE